MISCFFIRNLFMIRFLLITALVLTTMAVGAQRINQVPDTLRRPTPETPDKVAKKVQEDGQQSLTADDVIKNELVRIALRNPAFAIDDANVRIAELNRKRAGASWLNSISLGGNVNEFVIQNSPNATFYPKYNAGIVLPLGIFSTVKNEKRVADQNILIAKATKQQREMQIKAETLTRYEEFKEKSELVTLQGISLANNFDDYKLAQKNFEEGTITIEALNKVYQNYMNERNRLVTFKKELSVAIISLEEILGIPLDKAVPGLVNR